MKICLPIREGGKTVGAGVVTKIVSNALERSSIGDAGLKTGGCGSVPPLLPNLEDYEKSF